MRFYLVPKIGTGVKGDSYRAKYFDGFEKTAMDYGREGTMLVAANLTPAQHTTIAANGDVQAIPEALDAQIGAALATAQAAMEALNIPANWLTSAHTWRDALRIVGKAFKLLQRLDGRVQRTLFESGITLNTLVSAVPVQLRTQLEEAATSMGIDLTGITGSDTVRQAIRVWVAQLPPFTFGGERF